MPKTLSQLVKESVDKFIEENPEWSAEMGNAVAHNQKIRKAKSFLISSHISLIENEILREENLLVRNSEKVWTIEESVRHQVIEERITYLKGELEIIKTLV